MGEQTHDTIDGLAAALARVFAGRHVLLVASSDLSHFFDRETAQALDARVARTVGAFDPDALMAQMDRYPPHERGRYVMCGGGPAVAVMRAARALGATAGAVLAQTDSSTVSGDERRVVGYLAAVFGAFAGHRRAAVGEPC
jgi:AmmeMemoRadiSam system protein B